MTHTTTTIPVESGFQINVELTPNFFSDVALLWWLATGRQGWVL